MHMLPEPLSFQYSTGYVRIVGGVLENIPTELIEMTDSPVTIELKLFQNFHVKSYGTVLRFDGIQVKTLLTATLTDIIKIFSIQNINLRFRSRKLRNVRNGLIRQRESITFAIRHQRIPNR